MAKLGNRGKAGNKGFTLAEVVIVVAIIAILASIVVPQLSGQIQQSRASANMANAQIIANDISAKIVQAQMTGAEIPKHEDTEVSKPAGAEYKGMDPLISNPAIYFSDILGTAATSADAWTIKITTKDDPLTKVKIYTIEVTYGADDLQKTYTTTA